MRANLIIHFSELFADTYYTHGLRYCFEYYHDKHRMELWELEFWIKQVRGKI